MQFGKNYLQEIQKFTTSQYWNSGVRITTGIMVPMLIMARQGWLSSGLPFLLGALFVSLTDTPGPIHHRRNGMLVAILLNTFTVLVTGFFHKYPEMLLAEVVIFSFFYSMFGIFGSRASAVGTLAMVIMIINMWPHPEQQNCQVNALLTAGGGLWYTTLSLLLYRWKPYRLVEQALGENLMLIAAYLRARADFYKPGADMANCFNQMMRQQVDVQKAQSQMRELLFKTRQFVGDASPKSRSLMMIFLESLEIFEETMYAYQDFKSLQEHVDADVLKKFYGLLLNVTTELERIGLLIQTGTPIRKIPELNQSLADVEQTLLPYKERSDNPLTQHHVQGLTRTVKNVRGIVSRLGKIVLYTRLEAYDPARFPDQELEMPAEAEPMTLSLFVENFTIRSNHFRYAIRLTMALMTGFGIAAFLSLSHAYWVMLTIVTILKPVYTVTRERNVQRVLGTLIGVLLGSIILFVISNNTVLVITMIICMLIAYSLLRVNYLGFVVFLTTYVLITFHFLNPVQFKSLIGERLIDTLIGSIIAALAARFIFPVWQHYNIQPAMKKLLIANITYFLAAWNSLKDPIAHRKQYNAARNEAIVTLTNLTDNFQQMLAEPGQSKLYTHVHQFVIASHTLTGRISAFSSRDVAAITDADMLIQKILDTLQQGVMNLETDQKNSGTLSEINSNYDKEKLHALSIILSLADELRNITVRVTSKETV
jgi:uncharacterized membrane protein YccC